MSRGTLSDEQEHLNLPPQVLERNLFPIRAALVRFYHGTCALFFALKFLSPDRSCTPKGANFDHIT